MFLRQRRLLPQLVWRERSQAICDGLRHSSVFQSAKVVLAYSSFRQEPDLRPLLHPGCIDPSIGAQSGSPQAIRSQNNGGAPTFGLPRCHGKSLVWHVWDEVEFPLQPSTYGILEPLPHTLPIAVETVDLILIPAVACDRRGYRLGYGGGFYDRLLSSPEWSSKPTLGIVFEFARVDQLPNDPWDRPLDGVCTEAGLFWVDG